MVVMTEDEIEMTEAALAQGAVLELLASTLDEALPMVQRADRADDMRRIAEFCDRIGWLGQAADRLGRWESGGVMEGRA